MRALVVLAVLCLGVVSSFPAQGGDLTTAQQQHAPQQQPARPNIDWGKCPQLQPSDTERQSKALVIESCLKNVPFPQTQNVTEEQVIRHREDVTTCALKTEGWFDQNGSYKFDRARSEIINKKLQKAIHDQVIAKHDECKKEAEEKFQNQNVPQVQMYQACMDFHISQICGIQVQHHPDHYQAGAQQQQYQQAPAQGQQQGQQGQQFYNQRQQ